MSYKNLNIAGIYKLTCMNNGKIYIGKSINIKRRLNDHKNSEHKSKGKYHIQHAIIKYGWGSFDIEILETFENFNKMKDNDLLLKREAYYISLFESTSKDMGYNICEYSNDLTGKVLTDEHKEKIRKSSIGRIVSDETRKRLSQSGKNRIMTDDTKRKISESKSGIPSHRRGKTLPVEHREKISKSKMGKPSNRLGVKLSTDTIEKMKASRLMNKINKQTNNR